MEFRKFGHINSLEQACFDKKDALATCQDLLLVGSTKIHGSNGAILIHPQSKEYRFQKRTSFISIEHDNQGMVALLEPNIIDMVKRIIDAFPNATENICVYGEICGKGVQKVVGVSELRRFFCIFHVSVDGRSVPMIDWKELRFPEYRVFNVQDYGSFIIEHANLFTDLVNVKRQVMEVTLKIEEQCPVALGIGSIKGIGEGIVWIGYYPDGRKAIKFKSKGNAIWTLLFTLLGSNSLIGTKHEKNRGEMKNKTQNNVNVQEFTKETATTTRFDQALEYIQNRGLPLAKNGTSIQPYLHWIHADIMREYEYLLVQKNLDYHGDNIKAEVAKLAMSYYISRLADKA